MTAVLSLGPTVVTFVESPPAISSIHESTFSFIPSDSSATLECKVDTASYAACSSPYVTGPLADGLHTFSVRATNSFGSTVTSHAWNIDTMPPETNLTAWPQNPTTANSASFSFSSPDATAIFLCQLDGNGYVPCSSVTNYSGLVTGSHSFNVLAIDGAGNTDATPAAYSWTITACNARIGSTCYATLGEAYSWQTMAMSSWPKP